MMPGMMPGMMNPMMMMAMMQKMAQAQGGNAGGGANPMAAMAGMAGSSASKSAPKKEEPEEDAAILPEVQELCDYFNIEERWIKRLNETMRKRRDTLTEDIEKLYETLETARSPTGLLTVKIGEMESGRFIGKVKPDKDVERIARKFKLDDHVASRLTELTFRRKKDGEGERGARDLSIIEQHLRHCKRPNALATLLAGKLLEGEIDELPDLTEAEAIMEKYKLDEDAKSKLREICEKRAEDKKQVLEIVRKQLDNTANPSSMLCKIARPLIDHENLPEPPVHKGGGGKGGGKDKDGGGGKGGGRDRDHGGDRGRRDRSRSRKRSRSRRRSRSRGRRDRSRSRKRSRSKDKKRSRSRSRSKDKKEKKEKDDKKDDKKEEKDDKKEEKEDKEATGETAE